MDLHKIKFINMSGAGTFDVCTSDKIALSNHQPHSVESFWCPSHVIICKRARHAWNLFVSSAGGNEVEFNALPTAPHYAGTV